MTTGPWIGSGVAVGTTVGVAVAGTGVGLAAVGCGVGGNVAAGVSVGATGGLVAVGVSTGVVGLSVAVGISVAVGGMAIAVGLSVGATDGLVASPLHPSAQANSSASRTRAATRPPKAGRMAGNHPSNRRVSVAEFTPWPRPSAFLIDGLAC